MPKSKVNTRIPTHEEMKLLWTRLMFAADCIMTIWQECDTDLPSYIRQSAGTTPSTRERLHVALVSNLEDVRRIFPNRSFNPALEVVMEILGSEERMRQFSPEQLSSITRDAAKHATHVVYRLHLKCFLLMRLCCLRESGDDVASALIREFANFEHLLDNLMPRLALANHK